MLWAVVCAMALTACSAFAQRASAPPAPSGGPHPISSPLARAAITHEYPAPPVTQFARGGAATPTQAIDAFALAYINWTAPTVASDMSSLAARSIGQARSVAELAAAQTANDYELQRGGVANSGSVEAVAPLPGARDQFVVVTRELTTATNTTAYQGLAPAWHVALATVTELAIDRWVVSGWQPES